MQIGNSLIRNYDQNIQAGKGTEQTKGAEQSGQVRGQADLSSLSEGSVFRGEITDISGERVTIATDDKGQVTARLQADMELTVGDQLLFSVKENNTSQILIKPLFDSLYSAQTQVLERALEGTGLSPTEKNFSAAKELMEAGMPLDKANMVKLLSQSMKFEGTSMHTLAALNKMNIPVNAENIAQFERYQSLNHQLSGDISSVAEGMGDFVSAFPENTSGSELLSIAGELLEVFNSGDNASETVSEVSAEAAMFETGEGTTGEESVKGMISDEADSLLKSTGTENGANGKMMSSVSDKLPDNIKAPGDTASADGKTVQTGKDVSASEAAGKENASVNSSTPNSLSDSAFSDISEKTGLTKDEVNNLSSMLKNAEVPEQHIKDMLSGTDGSKDMLKEMLNELQNSSKNDQAVRNLLSSNEFKKLFSDMVKKEFALNPNEMKDPKEIDDLYNRILKQTQSFENTITAKGGDAGHFQGESQNMQQNMQFIQELNNQMIYAQMPLKLSNQNANSELFVYADKRKLAGKRDDISVMLHLDMDHLGATDIKVTLTGTNVNARFYLNDQESVDIITDNMGQLAKQLTERGFSLTNEVVMRNPKESPNKVVDEIIDDNAEKSIKRFTFDART